MKWTLLPFLFFFSLQLSGQSFTDQLQQATDAMEKDDAATAASLYESIRSEGYSSASLFLAQGNAYLAAGDKGRAILAYERGLRLKPGHQDLTNNLQFAETQLETVLTDLPGFFLERWWKWMGSRLGATTAYVLAIVFWWIAIIAFGIWFFKRSALGEKRRFLLLPGSALALVLALTFLFLGQSRNAELSRSDLAVLVAPTAPLRVAPGPEATLEQELTAGQRLRIVDTYQDRYVKVVLRDGKQGWLEREVLEVI